MLIINETGDIKGNNKLIEKFIKPKIGNLSKLGNLKSKKLFKS